MADDKDASLAAAVAPLEDKLAKQQQELDATTAALKAAKAVSSLQAANSSVLSVIRGSQFHWCAHKKVHSSISMRQFWGRQRVVNDMHLVTCIGCKESP